MSTEWVEAVFENGMADMDCGRFFVCGILGDPIHSPIGKYLELLRSKAIGKA